MKTYFQKLLQGSILGLGFLATILVGFYLVNAWTSNYAGLESQAGDKLTSSKLNSIVKRSTRIDVSTSDTTLFDTGCERRAFDGNGTFLSIDYNNGSKLLRPGINPSNYTADRRGINYNQKGTTYSQGTSLANGTISKIQKKCQN